MFGIGFLELVLIAIVFILFVGPKRLPEVMRQFGKIFVQAKRVSNEVKASIDTVVYEAERELHLENLKKIEALTKGTLSTASINDAINKTIEDAEKKEEKPKTEEEIKRLDAEAMDLHHDDMHKVSTGFERPAPVAQINATEHIAEKVENPKKEV